MVPDYLDRLLSERPAWHEDALCVQVGGDVFFPEPDSGGSVRQVKALCFGCDVRAQCLQFALEHDERHGIWGGLSELERRRLKGPPVPRPRVDPVLMARAVAMVTAGIPITQVARETGVSRSTIASACRRQAAA